MRSSTVHLQLCVLVACSGEDQKQYAAAARPVCMLQQQAHTAVHASVLKHNLHHTLAQFPHAAADTVVPLHMGLAWLHNVAALL